MEIINKARVKAAELQFEIDKRARLRPEQVKLQQAREAIVEIHTKMGEKLDQLVKAGKITQPELLHLHEPIVRIEQHIAEVQQMIDEINAEQFDASGIQQLGGSGQANLTGDSLTAPYPAATEFKFCSKCGSRIDARAVFCPDCGAKQMI